MNNEYNEKKFFNSFLQEYKINANDDNNSELIFQKNYNKLLETIHINNIIRHYSNQVDINDNYNKIKIGIILHMNLITYIMDDCIDDNDYDYCNDNDIDDIDNDNDDYDYDNDNDNDNYNKNDNDNQNDDRNYINVLK
jgi:hypothetical protein